MAAKSIREAMGAQHPTYVGGGTDLMPLLKNHVRSDKNLVFLGEVEELKGIVREDGYLTIGAGETLYDVAANPEVTKFFPAAAQAAGVTASPQIRNIATIGGNIMQDRRCIYFNQSRYWRGGLPLCFKTAGEVCLQIPNSPVCRAIYYSDVATALVLYEAEAECLEDGARSWVPVKELIARHSLANGLACSEHLDVLVLRFRIPQPPEGERSGFYKYAMRSTIDFPLINFALRCGGGRPARITAGAVAPEPVELVETARLLDRPDASDEDIVSACEAELKKRAMPIREACIPPAMKGGLYRQVAALMSLRR
ncbi:MAG: FAD binding domain-containing protein [Lawsonibacter sp.]